MAYIINRTSLGTINMTFTLATPIIVCTTTCVLPLNSLDMVYHLTDTAYINRLPHAITGLLGLIPGSHPVSHANTAVAGRQTGPSDRPSCSRSWPVFSNNAIPLHPLALWPDLDAWSSRPSTVPSGATAFYFLYPHSSWVDCLSCYFNEIVNSRD